MVDVALCWGRSDGLHIAQEADWQTSFNMQCTYCMYFAKNVHVLEPRYNQVTQLPYIRYLSHADIGKKIFYICYTRVGIWKLDCICMHNHSFAFMSNVYKLEKLFLVTIEV